MKKIAGYFAVSLSLILVLQACGPSQQEIDERERATRDSLERVQAMRQAAAELAAQEEQEEETEEYAADAEEERAEEEQASDPLPITFDPNGRYTLQVEAWRSRGKAEESVNTWRSRGFDQAYVVSYGQEETGDIWFRIRLGRFGSHAMAQRQKDNLQSDFNISAWIDHID